MPSSPDAIILCGGAGSRLGAIAADVPKSMLRMAHGPFLELLLKQLSRSSFRRVVLAVGYRKEAIMVHFGDRAFELELVYSPEGSPLGTGGALRNAVGFIKSDVCLVMNGDSYTDVNLCSLVEAYRQVHADASIVLVAVEGRSDCGRVRIRQSGWVETFEEKRCSARAEFANAGIYVISRQLLSSIPFGRQVSIERELFPQWLVEGRKIWGFISDAACVDIGTPERYAIARRVLAGVEMTQDPVHQRDPS